MKQAPEPADCTNGRGAPDSRRSIQTSNSPGVLENDACSEKAHARHDIGNNLRRVCRAGNQESALDKCRRAGCNQCIRPGPRHALPPLPLEADNNPHQKCRGEPNYELENLHSR